MVVIIYFGTMKKKIEKDVFKPKRIFLENFFFRKN